MQPTTRAEAPGPLFLLDGSSPYTLARVQLLVARELTRGYAAPISFWWRQLAYNPPPPAFNGFPGRWDPLEPTHPTRGSRHTHFIRPPPLQALHGQYAPVIYPGSSTRMILDPRPERSNEIVQTAASDHKYCDGIRIPAAPSSYISTPICPRQRRDGQTSRPP